MRREVAIIGAMLLATVLVVILLLFNAGAFDTGYSWPDPGSSVSNAPR